MFSFCTLNHSHQRSGVDWSVVARPWSPSPSEIQSCALHVAGAPYGGLSTGAPDAPDAPVSGLANTADRLRPEAVAAAQPAGFGHERHTVGLLKPPCGCIQSWVEHSQYGGCHTSSTCAAAAAVAPMVAAKHDADACCSDITAGGFSCAFSLFCCCL
jgi:hypothetical protein